MQGCQRQTNVESCVGARTKKTGQLGAQKDRIGDDGQQDWTYKRAWYGTREDQVVELEIDEHGAVSTRTRLGL